MNNLASFFQGMQSSGQPEAGIYHMPSITWIEDGIHKTSDPYSLMLKHRVVFLPCSVNAVSANAIVAQMLALDFQDPNKDIYLYINSGGGAVTEGLAIFDTMLSLNCKVNTVCIGQACSMGAFLLAAGTGTRTVMPHARVMIHQLLGGASGQGTDVMIQAAEMQRLKELLTEILAKNSSLTYDRMLSECERDNYLTPQMALKYGLVDEIGKSRHTVGERSFRPEASQV